MTTIKRRASPYARKRNPEARVSLKQDQDDSESLKPNGLKLVGYILNPFRAPYTFMQKEFVAVCVCDELGTGFHDRIGNNRRPPDTVILIEKDTS